MIRDITIGQYYPTDSVIHKLDPRVKLVGTIVFIISLFVFRSWVGYVLATLVLAAVIKISKVPFKFMIRGLKSIVILLLITVIFNLFLTPGETLIQIWKLRITKEGVVTAVFMIFRLMYLIIGSSVLTLTTTPIQLTDAIEYILKPFKRIGVPAHEIAMMMTIALRFIPTLLDETDKIMKAQQARGADFDTGNLIQKAKSLIPILVPLFISAFRRAEELAMAMEARCYHGDEHRTRMNVMTMKSSDYRAAVMAAVYTVVIIGLRFVAKAVPFII